MIDPTMQIQIDGETVSLARMVEVYKGLRWRRWPEEKPENGERIIILHARSIFSDENVVFSAEYRGFDTWLSDHCEASNSFTKQYPFWLPLSAVPQPVRPVDEMVRENQEMGLYEKNDKGEG